MQSVGFLGYKQKTFENCCLKKDLFFLMFVFVFAEVEKEKKGRLMMKDCRWGSAQWRPPHEQERGKGKLVLM